ncbi:MAG: GvpL/GvpF family gas vesicle protein [Actinomycetota bacterium]|nr:GvpL/GvpF family gas vesicle protein [Actinomycetota bacterium]
MIHVYALTAEPVALDGLHGVVGAAVALVDCAGLHAVVSRHRHPPAREPVRALEHAAVVEAVARTVPTLPVRFGSGYGDEQALQAAVAERRDHLSGQLRRIGHCVEFVVRIARQPEPQSSDAGAGAGSGRAYLQRRLALDQAARSAREATRHRLRARTATLVDLAILTSEQDGPRGPEAAYLVEARDAQEFRALADEVVAGDPSLVVGGPWPPYTFAAQPVDGS